MRKENVAQVAQKVTRLFLEKSVMKCYAGLRKVEDGLLNATKNLFLGKTLDTIAKQVYCYRLVLVSFYIHLFFFVVML